MTAEEVRQIYLERMVGWMDVCIENNATPVVMVAVKHQYFAGETVLCTLEEMDNKRLVKILEGTARMLKDESKVTYRKGQL